MEIDFHNRLLYTAYLLTLAIATNNCLVGRSRQTEVCVTNKYTAGLHSITLIGSIYVKV